MSETVIDQSPRLSRERRPMTDADRLLTEVDHLLALRVGPNQFLNTDDVLQNMATSMQEQAMPYAVTTTTHEIIEDGETGRKTAMWLGRTAIETAMSGYSYHKTEAAHARVDVEVDEAARATEIQQGHVKVFISPRMTDKDAPEAVAKDEHLADDDGLRISWLEKDIAGNEVRKLQSLLVRNIPLSAWIKILADEQSIFGKKIDVADEESALSVMKTHNELEIPAERLPNGPITILEEVVKYIDDDDLRIDVQRQISKYRHSDQEEMQRESEVKAAEWLSFDKQLAESLAESKATYEVKRFIYSLQHEWSSDDLAIIKKHASFGDDYVMTRELAALLESANQKLLVARAAVMVDPEHVLAQVGSVHALQQLQKNERLIQHAHLNGLDYQMLQSQQNRHIAIENIEGGGSGCVGKNKTSFGDEYVELGIQGLESLANGIGEVGESSSERSSWKWAKGQCRIEACASRPGETEVGPCDVCRDCQKSFDAGKDPTKAAPISAKRVKKVEKQAYSLANLMKVSKKDYELAA